MIKKLDNYINSERKNIEKEIKDWIQVQLLDDDSKYYNLDAINEVYHISLGHIEVSYDKYLLTYVNEKEYVATEMYFKIDYQVNILTDDENTMYKDDDTKEWKYFDTIEIPIKDKKTIKADIIFYFDNDEITNFEVEEINKGKSLTIGNRIYREDY